MFPSSLSTAVICNREIPGITGGALDSAEADPGPLLRQGDHGPVDYRNIVITPVKSARSWTRLFSEGWGPLHCNPARYTAMALLSSSVRRPDKARMTCARSLLRAPLLNSANCCTMYA